MNERRISYRGGSVWTAVVASVPPSVPILCVPGGPGLAHDYLVPLAQLAGLGRSVVFYDPFGSGRSPAPPGTTWSLDELRDEIDAVRAALGYERIHLLAHSAGGFPTIEYALAHPDRVASLVLSSTPIDMPAYELEVRRLLAELGPEPAAAFVRGEVDRRARDARYMQAYYEYVRRHICRFADEQEFYARVSAGFNTNVHRALKGGLLLYTTGPLGSWGATERLPAIAAPVLLTCGRVDVISEAACHDAARRLPRGEVAVFERSSHTQHVEESELFATTVAAFLARSESCPT